MNPEEIDKETKETIIENEKPQKIEELYVLLIME